MSDPISPPTIGFVAVSRSTTRCGVHCQGFGFTAAEAEAMTIDASRTDMTPAMTSFRMDAHWNEQGACGRHEKRDMPR